MTIDTIFTRYEVPENIRNRALARGAYLLALERAWVGPTVSWPLLTKTIIFADLGENGAHIRKKIGLDKYAVTLITRGVPKYAETLADGHDWHQKIYFYAAHNTGIHTVPTDTSVLARITKDVERNLLHDVPIPDVAPAEDARALRNINILHYKNPSV